MTTERRVFQLAVAGSTSSADCRAGRLMVPDTGLWRQLCDAGPWTDADAAVTCRQLGFDSGTAVTDGRYGRARVGRARVLDITCAGTERHLGQCEERFVANREDGGCPQGAAPVAVECFGRHSPEIDENEP